MREQADLDILTAEETAAIKAGQQAEIICRLQIRALKAELLIAESANETQREESANLLLRIRAAHGIKPEENAFLEEKDGVIRWVVK